MPSTYSRATVADRLALATALEEDDFSQRQQVACMDLPRSTLRDWQQRQRAIDVDPAWKAFFKQPGPVYVYSFDAPGRRTCNGPF